MPTYEYVCENCGKEFELFQRMSAAPIQDCPDCKGHVKRLIGEGAGIIFKGHGFYCTDYKNSSAPAGNTSHHHHNGEGSSSSASTAAKESAKSGGDSSKPAADTKPTSK